MSPDPSDAKKSKSDNKINEIQEDESKYIPYLSEIHNKLIQLSGKYPPRSGTKEWSASDIANWQIDKLMLGNGNEEVFKFKRQWVRGYRDSIKKAADIFDLPPELVAGVAFIEVGGDPLEIDKIAYSFRMDNSKDKTSFGNVSIQLRRAAESLNYGTGYQLTESQRRMILSSIENSQFSIFLAAKHLSDLRDLDFKGTKASDMNKNQIETIAARYNFGTEVPLDKMQSKLGYGRNVTKRWKELRNLIK